MINKIIRYFSVLFLLVFSKGIFAQNNTRSPYSLAGIGELEEPYFGWHASYGGLQQGLRSNRAYGIGNPASLSGIDNSVFDFGFRGDYGRQYSGNLRKDFINGNFNYLALGFPVFKKEKKERASNAFEEKQQNLVARTNIFRWSAAFGLTPYSNIGSGFSNKIDSSFSSYVVSYNITGGISRAFLANSFLIGEKLSIGVSNSFLFGQSNNYKLSILSDTFYGQSFEDEKVTSYKGIRSNVGFQFMPFGKSVSDSFFMVIGGSFGFSNNLQTKTSRLIRTYGFSSGGSLVFRDSILSVNDIKSTQTLPTEWAAGLTFGKKDKWMLGFDYSTMLWGINSKNIGTDSLKNSQAYSVSAAWTPNSASKKRMWRWEYRLGYRQFSSGYTFKDLNQNVQALNEYGIILGLGIPLLQRNPERRNSAKSLMNLSFEFINRGVNQNGMVNEKLFRIRAGFSLTEIWFIKNKYR